VCLTPACTCSRWTKDSRLGREVWRGGSRYRAGLVPEDDAIARMYERAIERLSRWVCAQRREFPFFWFLDWESRHTSPFIGKRRPYLGAGLDASCMPAQLSHPAAKTRTRQGWDTQDFVLRATTTDRSQGISRRAADSRDQHGSRPHSSTKEAWFLGLRMNVGIDVAALEREFGRAIVEPALETGESWWKMGS